MYVLSRLLYCTTPKIRRAPHFILTWHFIPKSSLLFCSSKPLTLRSFKGFQLHCYSSSSTNKKKKKTVPQADMDADNSFYIVRKGDLIGVYKSFAECQAQAGTSILDPAVSVFKGYSLSKEAESYLQSQGLHNAMYTLRASDIKEDLFGTLTPCPIQEPTEKAKKRRIQSVESKQEPSSELASGKSCVLEFDGASKGNPGRAGAGAILRAPNGTVICRLRENLGMATNNVAEYKAILLGLNYAHKKGFSEITVRGDSKLVCQQIQGLWKVKNDHLAALHGQALMLKEKFLSFKIEHMLRKYNSDADAEANFAVNLADGEVQEVYD